MTKTVTIDVPIEVRKTGPDRYQHAVSEDVVSMAYPEEHWRRVNSHGARAIVQAIDSGAFVDPLPTAEGAHIYNPELKVYFTLARYNVTALRWSSSRTLGSGYWYTPDQVQSYGPFEVLYDPEAKS